MTDLAHAMIAFDLLVLVVLLILSVVNTRYVRTTLDEQVRLMRRMSEAITWLVEDAKQDSMEEAQRTRKVVTETAEEIKQEIQQATRPIEKGERS